MSEKLPIGTRIRFPHDVTSPANEDHPAALYARAGEEGRITGYSNFWDYLVEVDGRPHEFGVERHEFTERP